MAEKIIFNEEEFIKARVEENLSNSQMAERFNMSMSTVKLNIKRLNLPNKSFEQRQQARENGMLKKCGVRHALQIPENVLKAQETLEKRTGYKCALNNPIVLAKAKDTCLKKYGVESVAKSKELIEKRKQTCLEKYGSTGPMGNKEVQDKSKASYFAKTGYYNPSQNPDVQQKKKNNCLEKIGVTNYSLRNYPKETLDIISSKENFQTFISQFPQSTIQELIEKLGMGASTFYRYIRNFELKDFLLEQGILTSKREDDLQNFISELNVNSIKTRKIIAPQELDVYCPDFKIAIEFNGIYWHSDIFKDKNYHENKSKKCEEQGIRLIHIYEDEWRDPVKQNIIKSLLKIAFNKVDSRIYARNCEIREISNEEAKPFNNLNHLQGHRSAQVTYGLFYNNELVQLMSFSKNKFNKNLKEEDSWEIIRGCPGSNNIVVGGVSKLFKHFVKMNHPKTVFSYCDFNKFDGKGYEALGMEFVGYTGPDMYWIINEKRIPRCPSKYKEYKKLADARLYGAGSKKYIWVNPEY